MPESFSDRLPPVLVLDSWPVLEALRGKQPAGLRFAQLVERVAYQQSRFQISRLNAGEIYYQTARDGGHDHARQTLKELARYVAIISINDELADAAAALKADFPMAFADCFAAALAMRLEAPLVTGDEDLRALEQAGLIRLIWLGA